jgi:hypothetical protein
MGKLVARRPATLAQRMEQGLGRLRFDDRSWSAVQKMWAKANGGGMKEKAIELHHWLFPARDIALNGRGLTNAGFNYIAVSRWLNQAMNPTRPFGPALEMAFRAIVPSMYMGIPSQAVEVATKDCGCD